MGLFSWVAKAVSSVAKAVTQVAVAVSTWNVVTTVSTAVSTITGIEHVEGTALDDELRGDAQNNRLSGGDGVDWLDGDAGDDILIGGKGNDTLTGGWGDDTLQGGAGDDRFVFNRADGFDVVADSDGWDTLEFRDLERNELSFHRDADDLSVLVNGTSNGMLIKDWFVAGGNAQIELMTFASGATLSASEVNAQLVQAMASFSPPAMGSTGGVIAQRGSQIDAVIAADWR